ncbi:MAG: hypothetical protein MIO92_10515, partial [Methanosarcinaceae archaeon]|nr:hypothetical protein [Methanosarcinaceae archaeon]
MKKNTIILFFVLFLIFTIFANASIAPETVDTKNKNAILLNNARFDTTMSTPALAKSSVEVSEYPPDIESYYIVQFKGPVHEAWKQEVTQTGAAILDYIPNNAFIVRMTSSVKLQVEALDNVQWVGTYQPAYKISSALNAPSTAAVKVDAEEVVEDVIVLLFDANDNGRVIAEINNLGGEILDSSGDILRVRMEGSGISGIAAINGVSWIEKYVPYVLFNDVAANITSAYTVHNTYGLTGSGQIVAVADTGLDTGTNDSTMHDDIEGRIVALIDLSDNG